MAVLIILLGSHYSPVFFFFFFLEKARGNLERGFIFEKVSLEDCKVYTPVVIGSTVQTGH